MVVLGVLIGGMVITNVPSKSSNWAPWSDEPWFLVEMAEPALFQALCGFLGLLVGSFLNVVIHRLPKMMERD